jgi:hypothetical protein
MNKEIAYSNKFEAQRVETIIQCHLKSNSRPSRTISVSITNCSTSNGTAFVNIWPSKHGLLLMTEYTIL